MVPRPQLPFKLHTWRSVTAIGSVCVLFALIALSSGVEARAAADIRRHDEPPKLDDTLTVAKSPFEPITMANGLPGARNNELPTTTRSLSSESSSSRVNEELALDNGSNSSSISGGNNSNGNDDKSATLEDQPTTNTSEEQESTTTTQSGAAEVSTPAPAAAAITPESPKLTPEETPTPSEPTAASGDTENISTTSAPTEEANETTTYRPPSSSQPEGEGSAAAVTTTTTQAPETTGSLSSAAPAATSSAVPVPEVASETITTTTTSTTTTTASPIEETTESAPEPPKEDSPLGEQPVDVPMKPEVTKEAEQEAPVGSPTTTTASPAPLDVGVTEPVASGEKEQQSPEKTTQEPQLASTTTTLAPTTPTSAPAVQSTEKPPLSTVDSSSSSSSSGGAQGKPELTVQFDSGSEKSKDKEGQQQQQQCTHLPSYSPEEVQKVFREETTFRNGTIKGKFTYINFDQRYRLVHYTRAPYGPVKIDLVEELGKPEPAAANSNGPSVASYPVNPMNDVPNSVLQLRNILPNSLFGFPFLGSNVGAQMKPLLGPREGGYDDRSNMYFYSTDSIPTPNLLTPSVPISLLPGQRIKTSHLRNNQPAADTLGQSYLDQLSGATASADKAPQLKSEQDKAAAVNGGQQQAAGSPNQFQYSNLPPESKGLMFAYLSHAQPQSHHYQLPYLLQAPGLIPQSLQYSYPSAAAEKGQDNAQQQQQRSFFDHHYHHHHQPHSHEHYGAPFMFAHPPSNAQANSGDSVEPSKLRLRVKTSKALNVNYADQSNKSAQLRVDQSSQGTYTAPANAPFQYFRNQQQQPRQRLGKQSHELKTPPINTSPVVYHVRSPSGRMFTVPHINNQAYALAYDRDN